MVAGRPAFAALLVSQRKIEMNVGVAGHRSSSAPQMLDGRVVLTQFLESTAQVITRDTTQRIERHRGNKSRTSLGELPHLVIRDSKIDVRFNPIWRKFHHALIILDRLRKHVLLRLTTQRGLEEFFRRRAGHRMQFCGPLWNIKWKSPLLPERIERPVGAGRNHQNIAPQFDQAKLLQRQRSAPKLLFDERDSPPQFPSGDPIKRDSLDRPESHQVAKTIEPLAPSCFRPNKTQPLPIAKTPRLESQDAPNFISSISVCQAAVPCVVPTFWNDYAPIVKSRVAEFPVSIHIQFTPPARVGPITISIQGAAHSERPATSPC